VGVGRSAGRFQPRAIVAIAVDENDRICDTLLMKGFTVFASPQKSRAPANILRNCSLM
jgi:glucitol operon activator protein